MLEGEALPAVEIRPHDEDRYSYEARYEIGRTDFICPAELGDDEAPWRRVAVATWEALDCAGFVRVDLILGDDGPEVLEVNAVPGPDRHLALPDGRRGGGDRLRGALRPARHVGG